ncbi:MAG TPA: outer membrane lipoprotein-sorting protein [Gammaproteobacteria bacterium]|nr:outer membrane lipoprotein-sorting protein [Gammaproteobacteria bacterium]
MNLFRIKLGFSVMALLFLFSESLVADDARDIMQQVIDRDDGFSQYSIQVIATCQYEINHRKLACVDKPRVKVIEVIQKDAGKNKKDSYSIMIIKKPSAEKGIGFLQYDYDERGRDTDQWMYLSAMGKIKRIVSGNDNEPKTGTLFGSEFSYEDTEKAKIENYEYKLIKQTKYKGHDVWIIESRPTPKHARKSNYSKSLLWVDKDRHLLLKTKLYDRRGRLIKQMSFSRYKKIDNIWIAQKINMNNVQSKRITTMKLQKIVLNRDIDDALISKRTLTDSAFREKQLDKIRLAKE